MTDFGDFTALVKTYDAATSGDEPALDTFDWYADSKIRLQPHVPPITYARFFNSLDAGSEAQAEGALYALLQKSIDPRDWPTFLSLAEENHVGPTDLLAIVEKIVEGRSGRPTPRRATSSAGSSSTSPTPTPDSAPPAAAPPSPSDQLAKDLGVQIPAGRPDVALALVRVDEEIPTDEAIAAASG